MFMKHPAHNYSINELVYKSATTRGGRVMQPSVALYLVLYYYDTQCSLYTA